MWQFSTCFVIVCFLTIMEASARFERLDKPMRGKVQTPPCKARTVMLAGRTNLAIDTQVRMKEKIGVFEIPHVIIVEPGGYVVWEGFPLLKENELTGQVVEKILGVGRNRRTAVGSSR